MHLRTIWPLIATLALAALAPAARAESCSAIKTFDEEIGKLGQLRDANNRREWLLMEYLRTEAGKRESKATTELKDWQASKAAQVDQASREIAAVKMGADAAFDEGSEDCRTVKKVLATYQGVEAKQKDLVSRFYTKDFPFLASCEQTADRVVKLHLMREQAGADRSGFDGLRALMNLTPAANAMLDESLATPGLDPRARQAWFGLRCVRDKQRKPLPPLAAAAPALVQCDVKDWFVLGLCMRDAIRGATPSKP
jgi:hypothetical protein